MFDWGLIHQQSAKVNKTTADGNMVAWKSGSSKHEVFKCNMVFNEGVRGGGGENETNNL